MLEVSDPTGVTWLTFDRPEKLNAFTGTGYRELRVALERARDDAATRVVVLTGRGRAFSAGAERSLVDGTAARDELDLASTEFAAMLAALDGCDMPVVAAVNGLAVGIGATMLLHCDLVLAAASARFRFPFTELGVVPEAGSTVLLAARARWDDAMWAMLSSEWIDAPAAHAIGLVWRVVADGELAAETGRVAAVLAAHDPEAVRATKRLLVDGRADAVRAAMGRELAAMRSLAERRGR